MDEEISKPRGLPEENGRENDAGVQFVLESKGKWWHAGYHLTTAIVGPTILALPYTFSGMGWAVGFLCLTVIGLVTFYAYYLMSKVLDHCEKQGRRHFRFRELAADVFGSGWMFYFVIIVQTAVNTGVAIGTILLSGECIENNDGKCVRQKELLSTYMDAQTGKSRKP
ncbi:probable GABA transporter 2 isoform X3 [Macadamia integrifolia]|uniref:probable GABA transporter 2 isoform X3 n=1 Tax=Macadamia integrifolia TaxID=60698 RepID=UPI001C4F1946|nr:probable GABA transporter 2 isoform X3 [Macadamia integrifolia]